jgi:transcriptional regulator with PAS, ATPase and Fis domain
MDLKYFQESQFAVTVCNENGIIIYMNNKSQKTFSNYGGNNLIGKSLLDCHPEPAKTMLAQMLITHIENSYTIEKNGVKKLIHQTPWFEGGVFKGYVEMSIEIPTDMPHYIRK